MWSRWASANSPGSRWLDLAHPALIGRVYAFTMNMASSWLTPKRLLWASVGVALVTIGLKTAAWWLTDSVGLLSDAMESLVNLASAMFGLMMVTIAERPADEDHPYGHHKAEYFSSGFEGILIIVAGLDPVTWLVFALWMAVGFAVYFAYSRRHSVLNKPPQVK